MHPRPILAAVTALVSLAACGAGDQAARSSTPATSTDLLAAAGAPTAIDDWLTYHRDNARTGDDPVGPTLAHPHVAWHSQTLDGQVYAEPLVAGGRVIVATENDTLYALSRASGRVLWRNHVAKPVDGASLPCGDISVSGITGTPVIDRAAGIVYAVAFLASGRQHQLVGVSLSSGHLRIRRAIDAPGANPATHQQRGALALARGRVIVPYGGLFGDCGTYHGQLLSAPAGSAHGAVRSYRVPSSGDAGIWAPSGEAIDAAAHIYVATGNARSASSADFGNSVIRLSAGLGVQGIFTQTGSASLNAHDTDLGSVAPLLLGDGRAYVIGKSGDGYLLNTAHLGGVGGQLGTLHVCDRGAYGGLALSAGLIYVPCGGIVAVRPGAGGSQAIAWRGPSFAAGPPIVASGALWTIDIGGGRLVALDLHNGNPLYTVAIGAPNHFSTPAASAGEILAAGGNRIVAVLAG